MKKNNNKNGLKLFVLYAIAIGALIYSISFLADKSKSEIKILKAKNKISSIGNTCMGI